MFEMNVLTEGILPSIAIRGIAPFPHTDLRIEIGRNVSKKALLEAEKNYDSHVLLLIQENPMHDMPTEANVLNHGVVAKIGIKIKLPNGNFKVKFDPIIRAELLQFQQTEPFFITRFKTIPTVQDNIDQELALVRMLAKQVVDNSKVLLKNPKASLDAIQKGVSSDKLCDVVANSLKISENLKFKYIETASLNQRLTYLLEDIEKEKYMGQIENQINMTVKKNIDENQKEYYLREKMRAIQEELGDKAKKESDIEELKLKILDKKMPSNIEEKALYELSRYQTLPASSGESGVIRTYLDFLVDLPWHEESVDEVDIKKAEDALDSTHFGLEKVKERIIEYLAVKILTGKNPQTILCLVGPPGVGKTSLAQSIAQALGRNFVKQSLGGVKDESEIRGHRRTYLGALPGRIMQGMKKAKVVNPVFLLDEIDKLGSDYKGDPSAALLEVLDPEQNAKFSDHYLEEQYDLSKVLFISTANYLGNVPAPLRDRMEIIELSSYTEIEKLNIANEHLIQKQLEAHGLDPEKFIIDDEATMEMIRSYTREAGVRQLDRLFGSLIRKSIKIILGDKKENVIINKDNLGSFLGKARFSNTKAEKKDQVGLVTGLAYTQFGGDTLAIEVTYYKGKGHLVLTGKLGDVMKESAQAALSYVKSNAERLGIDMNVFKENDIHIHVPEGAVPKDGPSAGVTITTAIVSALTGKKVDHFLGMTGEITLRGRVLPIGGLKEKSIAAHRSGLKTIMIPMDNKKDLEDIPKSIRESLEIIPVETVDEIITRALK
ncbi:Lon protease 1 [Candidatus Izimaplasma bacterium HR1]|jgi:ATP-dependent Lon protease|uniref:endopeptidase La n=1 Tax=Candidatus Izimoplasma sp. HR1 TaxID=1541959 RepID=UPI0004F88BC2|nr:Lon protease 1 [Candidatus Izimaplasma bacterium HR1]